MRTNGSPLGTYMHRAMLSGFLRGDTITIQECTAHGDLLFGVFILAVSIIIMFITEECATTGAIMRTSTTTSTENILKPFMRTIKATTTNTTIKDTG